MYDPDTSIGGDRDRFPVTRATIVEGLAASDPGVRTRAFDTLVRGYWKPVYKYLRIRWQATNEDAKDLTQEFFARCLEKRLLDGYDPARARFRTWLRVCLDGFAANERKSATRLKRGGRAPMLSLDVAGAEAELGRLQVQEGLDPERFFEQEWVRALFSAAVDRLQTWCAASGKEIHFDLFRTLDLEAPAAGRKPTYAELGREHGLPVSQVTNFLALARREFRRIVLELLREECGGEDEFRREARELLGTDPG